MFNIRLVDDPSDTFRDGDDALLEWIGEPNVHSWVVFIRHDDDVVRLGGRPDDVAWAMREAEKALTASLERTGDDT